MKESLIELENIIIENLKTTNLLKNEVEQKEIEKHDFLRDISLSIIDIIDSCEKIDEWAVDNQYDEVDESRKLNSRFKTIKKKLLALLQNYGVTKIEFPDNRLIAGLCEVVETEPDNNRKNDEIITVIRNGYIRGKDLIRPAEIVVVKN